MTIIMADRTHPMRARLEDAVRAMFLAEYGAYVSHFPTFLIAMIDNDGAPRAVTGLRFADDGLFSGIYLDDPIETVLAQHFERPVSRERVVEFTGMVAPRAGMAMPLVGAAIRFCRTAGADYGVFTATRRLRTMLARNRLSVVDLGVARRDRLPNPVAWGSYYLHDPRVLAVSAETLPPMLTAMADEGGRRQHA